jgi:hypothetical protein
MLQGVSFVHFNIHVTPHHIPSWHDATSSSLKLHEFGMECMGAAGGCIMMGHSIALSFSIFHQATATSLEKGFEM